MILIHSAKIEHHAGKAIRHVPFSTSFARS